MLKEPKRQLQPGGYDAFRTHDDSADYAYADTIASVLSKNGVRVLRNEYSETMIDGRKVVIVGVDDGWAGKGKPTSGA